MSKNAFTLIGGQRIVNVHSEELCKGRACCVHNPSEHHMSTWKQNFRPDRYMMERLCPEHGVGHPDPDDAAWQLENNPNYTSIHGCCGCCVEEAISNDQTSGVD